MSEVPDFIKPHLPQIEEAAWRGYQQAALDSGGFYSAEQAFAMGACRKVTLELRQSLAGIEDIEHTLHIRGTETLRVDEHQYLEVSPRMQKMGGVIIDATWQQFIPKPDPVRLPRIFIGKREDLQNLATDLGADEWSVELWNEQGPGRYLTPAERIARAYDEQMANKHKNNQ